MRSLAQKILRSRPSRPMVLLAAAGSLCLAGLVLGFEVAPASGQTKATAIPVVNVTLGGSDDRTILLSKGLVQFGKVTFNVRNTGKKKHSFELCVGVTYSATANSCIGTATKILEHGQTAKLTLTLSQGIHEFLRTVPSDAKAGIRAASTPSRSRRRRPSTRALPRPARTRSPRR
jgi:hypothetical protein